MDQLTYRKQRNSFHQIEYMAQTPTHRYLVRRNRRPGHKSEWLAEVWTLRTVGVIHPLTVRDERVLTIDYCYTRAQVYRLVQEHAEAQPTT